MVRLPPIPRGQFTKFSELYAYKTPNICFRHFWTDHHSGYRYTINIFHHKICSFHNINQIKCKNEFKHLHSSILW